MKEKLISQVHDDRVKRLTGLSEELADAASDIRELQEAINAGNAVLNGLRNVIASLKSAKNWGTWDMLGVHAHFRQVIPQSARRLIYATGVFRTLAEPRA